MFKKLMCVALSIMMVLGTIQVTGFAAGYKSGNLVASHVAFNESVKDGKTTITATIDVENVASGSGEETAVFWLGEYVDGILVESDFKKISVKDGEKAEDVVLKLEKVERKDENGKAIESVFKAYIWKDVVRGAAIAPVATLGAGASDELINYVEFKTGDEVEEWNEFDEDVMEYNIVLERTQFDIPQFNFYAKNNATEIVCPVDTEKFVLGKNEVAVYDSESGDEKWYTFNISYKKASFKNFQSAALSEKEICEVPAEGPTTSNYDAPEMKGASAYIGFPKLSNGSVNNSGPVTSYLSTLGYQEGRLYVFKSSKGPNNNAAWYQGGVDTYDGTNGNYFLTFDIEAEGTMYLCMTEYTATGKKNDISLDTYTANFIKEGYKPLTSDATILYKKYYPGETVKVPAMGWHSSWTEKLGEDARNYTDSTYFLFGYDEDPTAAPKPFDETDTKLKSFTYTVAGETKTVGGFDATVAGGTYEVEVPTGTEVVTIDADRNDAYAKVAFSAKEITLVNGTATATVTVTSKNGNTAEYKVTFTEILADPTDATLKSLTYKVGDNEAVELLEADKDRYYVFLTEGTLATDVKVEAEATVGNDKASVVVEDVTAWVNHEATAIVTVTSINGEIVKTYYIDFEVEKHISEQPNKIYNLTSEDKYKKDNNGYQTESEVAAATGMIVIGENLSTESLAFYDRTDLKFSGISDDMINASYIRVLRNHASTTTVEASEPVTRTVEGQSPETQDKFGSISKKYGFRTNDSLEQSWYKGAFSADNSEPGWIEFNVSSDCTVVIADIAGYDYPNLDKTIWKESEADVNKIYGTKKTYYREYNAGDLVQIPNYGIGGKLADTTKVTYSYKDTEGVSQVYETTVGKDILVWNEIAIAVKWSKAVSADNSLKSVTVDGKALDLSSMNDNTLTFTADQTEGELLLAVEANDENAEVEAPATVAIGETATITVKAENGNVATYYINVVAKAKYKIINPTSNGDEWYNGDNGIYGTKELKSYGNNKIVAVEGISTDDSNTISAWTNRTNQEMLYVGPSIINATAILTNRQAADPGTSSVKVYRQNDDGEWVNDSLASFTRQVEGEEAETYTGKKYNNSSSIGFTYTENGSMDKPFFEGDYDGTNGDWWITFVPTSDCTVVLADWIGYDWKNLKKDEWTPSYYKYLGEGRKTYSKHFKEGEVVQIPNYGIIDEKYDTRNVTYTYYDENGNETTKTMKVYQEWQNWRNIGMLVVWDDFSIVSDASSLLIDGVAIEGFKADEKEYTYILEDTETEVELTAVIEGAATATGLGKYKAGQVAEVVITAGDGKTKSVYKVTFRTKSADATLSALTYSVDGEAVSVPEFAADKYEYTVELEAGTQAVEIAATKNDELAEMEITQATIENGAGVATVVVKAEDGSEKTYTVNFVVAAPEAVKLTSVKVNGKDAELQSDGSYLAKVASNVTSATVEAIAEDNQAEVSYVPGATVEKLVAGEYTVVTVTVSANGASNDYTVKIYRSVDTEMEGTEDGGNM